MVEHADWKAVDAAVVQAAVFDEKAAGYCHAKGSSDCSELRDRLVLRRRGATSLWGFVSKSCGGRGPSAVRDLRWPHRHHDRGDSVRGDQLCSTSY